VDEVRVAGEDEGREDDCGLLDRLGLAVIHLDESAMLVSYNLSAERLLGWADGSRRGRSFGEVLTGSTGLDPDESVVAALAAGRSWAGPLTAHGSGTDVGPVAATVVPVRGLDARAWFVVLLLAPDSGLWPLLTGVLDGWLVLHATGRVTYADEHATWLLGSPGSELGRTSVLVPPGRAHEPLGAVLARHLTSSAPEEALELQVDRDELSGWVEATVLRTNTSGPLAGVVWRVRDVTGRFREERRHAVLSEELQGALDTRVEIEQAKGFLAGRDGIGTDEAFRRLRGHARDRNLGIREVARQVVARQLLLRPEA
jgi:PAS domain-containing protein